MNEFVEVLRAYAQFSGRARRRTYWMYVLVCFVISVVLMLVDGILGTGDPAAGGAGLLTGLFALLTFFPGLAVAVRRLHDTGRRGWWLLVSFIPLVGGLVLLVFLVQDSQPGENRWGPSPKAGLPAY